jgi:hypothetical protein
MAEGDVSTSSFSRQLFGQCRGTCDEQHPGLYERGQAIILIFSAKCGRAEFRITSMKEASDIKHNIPCLLHVLRLLYSAYWGQHMI